VKPGPRSEAHEGERSAASQDQYHRDQYRQHAGITLALNLLFRLLGCHQAFQRRQLRCSGLIVTRLHDDAPISADSNL
jgi:hypothetical protein